MVATMIWWSELRSLMFSETKKKNNKNNNCSHAFRPEKASTLGILAFETAKIMSRIVSLYKSLSDEQIFKLRKDVLKSEGVVYLNSRDTIHLLRLACAERIEDLDRAAIAAGRLGKKCLDPGLNRFEHVYADLKNGLIDFVKLDYSSKEFERIVEKMEKYISSTSNLYLALEAVTEMELSERKMKQWNNHKMMNSDLFNQKLSHQRQQLRHYRDVSLWNKTFDKSVGLMAKTVCVLYSRICFIFGPYSVPIHDKPPAMDMVVSSKSGPMKPPGLIRFWNRESKTVPSDDIVIGVATPINISGFTIEFEDNHFYVFGGVGKRNKLSQVAPPSTVGGSGLASRYANLIIMAEKHLNSKGSIGNHARESMYEILPESVKKMVRLKLKKSWKKSGKGGRTAGLWDDHMLAEGWREALKGIMGWLAPMAHDTLRWQTERNFEKQNLKAKPTVLLLQTLHFSDREKTEAAIVQILVGLSYICRYESNSSSSSCGD